MSMTQQKLTEGIAVILTTALETSPPLPLGPVYMALASKDWTYEEWEFLICQLRKAKLARITSETLTLTPKGTTLAQNIMAALGQ